MRDKKTIIIFILLCLIALMLGYWYGLPKKGSPEVKKLEASKAASKAKAKKPTPNPPKVGPNTPKAGAAIEAAVRRAASKPTGKLTRADLEKVTYLRIYKSNVTDIGRLAKLTNLEELHLSDNQITDLSPLAGLKHLKTIDLHINKIIHVSPLAGLKKLEYLAITNNPLNKPELEKLKKALPNCKIGHN